MVVGCECDCCSSEMKVQTRTAYFHVCRLRTVDVPGLFENLKNALYRLGISSVNAETCTKLVGIGSDRPSANIARGGLKGLVELQCGCIFWMWCFAHRLELAVKDALQGTFFDAVDDMLLWLYYLYENAPKKIRELEEVVAYLKDCISMEEGGVKPIIRASGS